MVILKKIIDENLKKQIQAFIKENFEIDQDDRPLFASAIRSILDKIRDTEDTVAQGALHIPNKSKLHELLEAKKPTFSETLSAFIDKSGLKDSEVYNKAGISRQLFSKIRIHPNYKPTKATVLMFALALELDVEDTKELLSSAGFTLSHSVRQDLILEFLIENGFHKIDFVNDVLYEFGEPTLGV